MKTVIITRKWLTAAASILLVIMVCIGVVASVMGAASSRKLPIYCVENFNKQVGITFDAAWGADDTDELIKILGEYRAKATFFVVGDWVDRYPEQVKKLHDAGHVIANHSNAHGHIDTMSYESFVADVRECNRKIEKLTGQKVTLYRGPYGEYNDMSVRAVEEMGMYYIQWDCDSRDWKKDYTVQRIVDSALKGISSGSILLFHNDAKNTPAALRQVLKQLSKDGYSFITVDELILKENYYIDHAGKQCNIQQSAR